MRVVVLLMVLLGGCTANLLRHQDDDNGPASNMALVEKLLVEQQAMIQRVTELAMESQSCPPRLRRLVRR